MSIQYTLGWSFCTRCYACGLCISCVLSHLVLPQRARGRACGSRAVAVGSLAAAAAERSCVSAPSFLSSFPLPCSPCGLPSCDALPLLPSPPPARPSLRLLLPWPRLCCAARCMGLLLPHRASAVCSPSLRFPPLLPAVAGCTRVPCAAVVRCTTVPRSSMAAAISYRGRLSNDASR
jgi:hypothetical protein